MRYAEGVWLIRAYRRTIRGMGAGDVNRRISEWNRGLCRDFDFGTRRARLVGGGENHC
jgi:hypothetical protein